MFINEKMSDTVSNLLCIRTNIVIKVKHPLNFETPKRKSETPFRVIRKAPQFVAFAYTSSQVPLSLLFYKRNHINRKLSYDACFLNCITLSKNKSFINRIHIN